jgi:uncharacterized protein (TIRG00374 family)
MKRWLSILLNLLGLILFALIVWWGGPETWQQLLAGDWRWVLVGLLLHGVVGMLSGWRLQLAAEVVAGRPLASWRRFYHLSMTARALAIILPRSVSTFGGKSVGLRAMGLSLRRGLWAILIDNGFDIVLLAALSIPGVFLLQGAIGVPLFLWLLVVVTALTAVIVWWATQPHRLDFLFRWIQRWRWLAQKLKLEGETAVLPLPTPRQSLHILAITFAIHILLAFTAYALAQAIDLSLSWISFLAIQPITQLSLVAAIAPGGLGTYDFTWLGLLLLVGVTQAEANIYAVAQRIYVTVFVLIWAGVSALLGLSEKRLSV